MMINLKKLSTPALLELLRDVSREIETRLSTPIEQRVAEIAAEFGAWVEKQGLPTSAGTGAWRKAAEKYSIGFAQER